MGKNWISCEINVRDIDYLCEHARVPDSDDHLCKELECPSSPLEVWDGSQALVEHTDQLWMERVGGLDLFAVGRRLISPARKADSLLY